MSVLFIILAVGGVKAEAGGSPLRLAVSCPEEWWTELERAWHWRAGLGPKVLSTLPGQVLAPQRAFILWF